MAPHTPKGMRMLYDTSLNWISMIEMPVRPTLGVMSTGHNINGALSIGHLNLIGMWFNEDQRTNIIFKKLKKLKKKHV